MRKVSYKGFSVILLCVGAFLLAINQLSFAILCAKDQAMYSQYIPMSGDLDILTVKIGVILFILSAVLFVLDLFLGNKENT